MSEEDAAYWRWRDELLKHPDGRARGGEPCVQCGNPIPPNTGWVQRDRHLCSSSCNTKRGRWFLRELRNGTFASKPAPRPNPRTDFSPQTFGTLPGVRNEVPYEFSGYQPLHGDTVERHGVVTTYRVTEATGLSDGMASHAPHGIYLAIHLPSRQRQAWAATEAGGPSKLELSGLFSGMLPIESTWNHMGIAYKWCHETINDVAPSGIDYQWKAVVARTADSALAERWSTPAYQSFEMKRARTIASEGRHARRVRIEAATIERFDPHEIFERDGWACKLCGLLVDRERAWPDPMSPSLDHVLPLAAGGEHSRKNTQLAHWICNVRKGAKTE